MRLIALLALSALAACAADNVLSRQEKSQGYLLLFDGKTFANWKDPSKKNVPNNAWVIDNGTLKTVVAGKKFSEDLISEKLYADFDLVFDWKISAKGNTGLKYRIQREIFLDETKAGRIPFEAMLGKETREHFSDRTTFTTGVAQVYTVGFEFQLLDNEGHPDGRRDASHRTGALYSFIPSTKDAANAPGKWNSSRLMVKGEHFEHWINGTKVLEGSLKDPAVKAGAEKRWGPAAPVVRDLLVNAAPKGGIALQHHGDEVWFKNIRIREIK